MQSTTLLKHSLVCGLLSLSRLGADEWPQIQASYSQVEWIAGLNGESPDNGNEWNGAEGLPAVQAELSEPHSAMADAAGNVYVADKNAHAIRRISPDGILTTVAGTNVKGYNGDGPATLRQLDGPQHVYVLPDGTLFVLDSSNRRIRRVDRNGIMTTIITDSAQLSRGLWVSRDQSIVYYCTETTLKRWVPAMGNTSGIAIAAGFVDSGNIDVAVNGDIYVTDRGGSRVYRVPPGNVVTTPPIPVAGVGGDSSNGPGASGRPALEIGMREARAIAFHPLGGFFVATHRGGDVWYVDTDNRAWMFIEGDDNKVHSTDPVPIPTSRKAFSEPRSISVALNGDLYLATNDAGYIRRVRYTGPHPDSPASFRATGSPAAGFTLRWLPTPGHASLVEYTADLSAPAWLPGPLLPPSAVEQTWSSGPLLPQGARYFRIRALRTWPN